MEIDSFEAAAEKLSAIYYTLAFLLGKIITPSIYVQPNRDGRIFAHTIIDRLLSLAEDLDFEPLCEPVRETVHRALGLWVAAANQAADPHPHPSRRAGILFGLTETLNILNEVVDELRDMT